MATIRFPLVVGALIRTSVMHSVKYEMDARNIRYEIKEDRGFLESYYRVAASGEDQDILGFQRWLHDFLQYVESETAPMPEAKDEPAPPTTPWVPIALVLAVVLLVTCGMVL